MKESLMICPYCSEDLVEVAVQLIERPYDRLTTKHECKCKMCDKLFTIERQWEMIDEERVEYLFQKL